MMASREVGESLVGREKRGRLQRVPPRSLSSNKSDYLRGTLSNEGDLEGVV